MNLSKILLFVSCVVAAAPSIAQDVAPAKLTAAEVSTLATIAAIDKSEILVSVVAANKDVDSDVKDFAKMMIDQHGSNLDQILEMANNVSLNGGDSGKIAEQSKKDLQKLGALHGKAFSIAYADAMVAGHQGALNLIDQRLMKTATTEPVKKFLTDTRATVAEHLEHAKKMQQELKS